MSIKSRWHSWLCVWLCCVLSAILPTSPFMLSMLAEETRVAESDPVGSSEEVQVGEVTLPDSSTGRQRQRREQVRMRTTLSANQRLCAGRPAADNGGSPLAGQGSLRGRCGPLRC